MMKRILFSLSIPFFFLLVNGWAAPLEFFATVTGKSTSDSVTILQVQVTPSLSLDVTVTTVTELKDADGNPIAIDDVDEGSTVAIEAVHTSGGFLALEIQLQEVAEDFSIKGYLEAVNASEFTIKIQGFTILTDESTRIRDESREAITLDDLAARLDAAGSSGLLARVDGVYTDSGLLATRIKLLENDHFARISLEGVISEFLSEDQFILDIGGGTQATVNILPETVLVGEPVAGLTVKVVGRLAPDLTVNALRIRVLGLFELSPDDVEMGYEETQDVTVLLRQPLESDLTVQITCADPSVASCSVDSLTIRAGELSGVFQVTSGTTDGRTLVTVAAGDAFGGYSRNLKIAVGEGVPGTRPTQIQWTPSVVRAAPQGHVDVHLMFKYGRAQEDIPIGLELIDASADLDLQYPANVVIQQGDNSVGIELLFGAQAGSGKLVAHLPEDMGGGTAELDIDLRSSSQAPMHLSWSEKKIDVAPATDFTMTLRLSRVAEGEILILITPVSGDRGVLSSMESQVTVPAGKQTVDVPLQSSEKTGRVKLRAALPRELGGAHADLSITVK
jgi:hypothetical protein